MFEIAHNLVLNQNGAKLTHMSYLKYSILKNEVRYCKQALCLLAQTPFGCRVHLHQSSVLSSLKSMRAD
jgi:hypothetical protein